MKQRILAILLSLTMMFTLVPTAMAEGETAVAAVAKVGNVEYATLAEAVEAAKDGETVTLLKDAELTETLNINKAITLDGANHIITGDSSAKESLIKVQTDGDFTLTNCIFAPNTPVNINNNKVEAGVRTAVYLKIGGTATVTNNTFEGVDNGYYNAIEFGIGDDPSLKNATISGNTFTKTIKNNYFNFYNMQEEAVINITNNQFLLANKSSNGIRISNNKNVSATFNLDSNTYTYAATSEDSEYEGLILLQDYAGQNAVQDFKKIVINITNLTAPEDAKQILYVYDDQEGIIQTNQPVVKGDSSIEKFFVAKVGDTYYKTLAEAVAAADNATVTLLKDVTANVTIPASKTITLDLNGNDITVNDGCAIVNKGTLTVTGSGNVTTSANGSAAVANFPDAAVNLNGGTYSSSSWYVIKNMGGMVINGPVTMKKPDGSTDTSSLIDNGWVSNEDTVAGESVAAQADKAKLTIKSGDFTGKAGSASCSVVKNDDYGVLEINGGRFDSTNNTGTSNATTILNWNVATISGGTFKGSYPISNGSYANTADQGKLTITGGNFSGTSSLFGQAQGGTSGEGKVTITDGSFKAPQFGAFDYAVEISGGSFSQSVERKYLDQSLNAELKRTGGETPYSYYPDVAAAAAAAQPGDTVTDLKATTESKVTLTLKYNDGATADTTYNVASGTTITLPAPTRIGYTFNGWYDGSKFYAAGASYKVSATATLNASWSYISSGSSSYDPTYSVSTPSKTENGSVTVSPKSASKGDTVTVTVKPDSGYVLETLTVTDKNGNELTLKDKGDGKYTFTMPAGKVEVKATFMEDNSMLNFFYDVPNGAYFYEAVKWAVKNGITTGVGNDLFAPEQPCTRAQIVTFLWRAAGSPEPKTASSFTDVSASAYYAKAVAWAVENGITNGMTETTFAPDATCTRGQSVTFLYRALKGTASGSANFTDVKSDAFYADAINWAVANNVTNGTSNTTFSPNADCTRAEIVTFLYRAYQGK